LLFAVIHAEKSNIRSDFMKRTLFTFLLFSVLLANTREYSSAQWSTDPHSPLIVDYGLNPRLTSDSTGGCYVTYEQYTSYPRSLFIQRLNRLGEKPWGVAKRIWGVLPEQRSAQLCEDGFAGVIIAYLDLLLKPSNPSDQATVVRVQRIDSTGRSLWDSAGVSVTVGDTLQGNQVVTSDGHGGCVVAWMYGAVAHVQRIDSAGNRCWGDHGIVIDSHTQYYPKIVRMGSAGVVVSLASVLRRVRLSGEQAWGTGGIQAIGGALDMKVDNSGDLLVSGIDGIPPFYPDTSEFIVVQKLDSNGNFKWSGSRVVASGPSRMLFLRLPLSIDGANNVSVVWGQLIDTTETFYCQLISTTGQIQWPQQGIVVSNAKENQLGQYVVEGLDGRMIVLWTGSRNGYNTYGQCFGLDGRRMWDSSDVLISSPEFQYVGVVGDMNGGLIVAGFIESDFSIRAQQVNRDGVLGTIITDMKEPKEPERSPSQFMLSQSYPNPFNPSTNIAYTLQSQSYVTLKVYDLLGRELAILAQGKIDAGNHSAAWNANGYGSGVYFYKLEATSVSDGRRFTDVKKMVLVR
jgi:hypothetical protein